MAAAKAENRKVAEVQGAGSSPVGHLFKLT
jgi:hypothetical protein